MDQGLLLTGHQWHIRTALLNNMKPLKGSEKLPSFENELLNTYAYTYTYRYIPIETHTNTHIDAYIHTYLYLRHIYICI